MEYKGIISQQCALKALKFVPITWIEHKSSFRLNLEACSPDLPLKGRLNT